MLKNLLEKDLVRYIELDEDITWENSIIMSYNNMKEKGIVEDQYIDSVIECVKKYGPYIVIMDDVAMPHSTLGAGGVNKTEIGFTIFSRPVKFDEEKSAYLFFNLAAVDSDAHLKNIVALTDLLGDDAMVEKLRHCKSLEDVKALIK